jgi:hypothetical protein
MPIADRCMCGVCAGMFISNDIFRTNYEMGEYANYENTNVTKANASDI